MMMMVMMLMMMMMMMMMMVRQRERGHLGSSQRSQVAVRQVEMFGNEKRCERFSV